MRSKERRSFDDEGKRIMFFFFTRKREQERVLFFDKECANALRILCPGWFILAESVVTKNISTLLGDRFLKDKKVTVFLRFIAELERKK